MLAFIYFEKTKNSKVCINLFTVHAQIENEWGKLQVEIKTEIWSFVKIYLNFILKKSR